MCHHLHISTGSLVCQHLTRIPGSTVSKDMMTSATKRLMSEPTTPQKTSSISSAVVYQASTELRPPPAPKTESGLSTGQLLSQGFVSPTPGQIHGGDLPKTSQKTKCVVSFRVKLHGFFLPEIIETIIVCFCGSRKTERRFLRSSKK